MIRALQTSTRCYFFSAENGRYRYYYYPAKGRHPSVLKIQMTKARMVEFRASAQGRDVERFVEITEQGCGWYEVRGADLYKFRIVFGMHQDGLKMWLRELNISNLKTVNANTEYSTAYREPTRSWVREVVAVKEERDNVLLVERLRAAYMVDPSKLEALAAKFPARRHH
jgi:hypothetical protein